MIEFFIVVSFFVLALAIFLFAWNRNDAVHRERLKVIDDISKLADEDIRRDLPWEWRYEAYEKISYNKMFFTFWRPVSSFYDGNECLRKS